MTDRHETVDQSELNGEPVALDAEGLVQPERFERIRRVGSGAVETAKNIGERTAQVAKKAGEVTVDAAEAVASNAGDIAGDIISALPDSDWLSDLFNI